jgi:hypothetical protein
LGRERLARGFWQAGMLARKQLRGPSFFQNDLSMFKELQEY